MAEPTLTPPPRPTVNHEQRLQELRRLEELVGNVLTSRHELFRQLLDPRRNIDDECGYPSSSTNQVNLTIYQELYDREAVAARVVEVLPRETWQVQPIVYEDESSDVSTPFEEAWDDLSSQLRGEQSYFKDEKSSPVWEYLRRADELSGIGQFGIILLGIDDGKDLREPVDGMEIGTPNAPGDVTGLSGTGGISSQPPPNPYGSYKGSIQGSDAQYFQSTTLIPGAELPAGSVDAPTTPITPPPNDVSDSSFDTSTLSSIPQEEPSGSRRKLLYLRVFPESLVQITQFESRPTSPRFGQPVMYRVTFNDPREQHSGVGLPIATLNVHWSRVIHIADTQHQSSSSEVFGVPRMRPVLNRLLDLRKLYSGSAEMYWRGAFPGMSFETHPQLGGDVEIDKPALQSMYEEYSNGLQRVLFLMGMTAKTLSPTVVDPTSQIDVQITAICIKIDCPKRVFMGSERGELASSQDDQAWNDTLRERQAVYVTPRIIVPFIDRLIAIGILPKPTVRKPAQSLTKPFALEKPPPPQPPAIGPDGKPMGGGGIPSKPPPAKGQPAAAPGTFPPKAAGSNGAPAFPPKPSFNRAPTRNAPFGGMDSLGDREDMTSTSPPQDGTDPNPPLDSDADTVPDPASDQSLEPPPKPQKPGYRIEWPDLTSQSDSEKATISNTRTTALAAYISGGVDALVPPLEFLTKIMGIPEEEAQSIIQSAADAQDAAALEKQQQSGGIGPDGQPLPPDTQPPGQSSLPTSSPGLQGTAAGGSIPPTSSEDGIMPKSPLVKE